MKQTRFLTARFKIHAQNGQPQWKCNSYLIMPESIYLPPFSLNQWLRIIISKRQNSSGTLIPLCSTDQHISEVKFANTDIYHRRVNGYDNHINWGGGGGGGETATKIRRHLREIFGLYTNLTESGIACPGKQKNSAQWLDFTFFIPREQLQTIDSNFCLYAEGRRDVYWTTWMMSFLRTENFTVTKTKRKHGGKHLWHATNTVLAQGGKCYCTRRINTQIVEEFRFSTQTISQPFRNDIPGKISSRW